MRSRRVRKVASSWCQLGPDTATDVVSQGNALRPFAELRPGNAFGVGFQSASGENLRICILLRMRVAKSSQCVYWRSARHDGLGLVLLPFTRRKTQGYVAIFRISGISAPYHIGRSSCGARDGMSMHAKGGQFYGRKGSKTTFRGTRRAAKRAKFVKLT